MPKNNIYHLFFNKLEEARKEFKTFVNILATIKNENNEKYLILRKKYYDEVPGDDQSNMSFVSSSSMMSLPSEMIESPIKSLPPPYRAPPKIDLNSPSASPFHQPIPISMTTVGLPILEPHTKEQYKECVSEFQQVMSNFMDNSNKVEKVDVASRKNSFEQIIEEQAPSLPPRKKVDNRSFSRENSIEKSFEINKDDNKENTQTPSPNEESKGVSVKEAMLKFNRFAEAEEAKVPSPMSKLLKNKTEKVSLLLMYFV